jgi:hypothetical protein
MQNGHDFDGFREAPINFSPTYKYDVLRTIKRPKKKRKAWRHSMEKLDDLCRVETGEVEEEDEFFTEMVSDASTLATPANATKLATEAEGEYFMTDHQTSTDIALVQTGAMVSKRASLRLLAPKWISKWKKASKFPFLDKSAQLSETTPLASVSSATENGNLKQVTPPLQSLSPPPQKGDTTQNDCNDETNRGVYDSSSKQRVPSW